MIRRLIVFSFCMLLSCDSFYNHIALANKEKGREVKIILDDNDSFISIECKLLKSKSSIRPSHVIFTLHILPKKPNIYFESNNALIYLSEANPEILIELLLTNNTLTENKLEINKKSKFQISGIINQVEMGSNGKIKLGLKIPPIVIEQRKINFEIIEFEVF